MARENIQVKCFSIEGDVLTR